jgi:F-type H+-transporting ATPase subunit epsilon
MQLTIISPEKELYNGEAALVQFPGTEGSFEVLPGHAKMIVTLSGGNIRIMVNQQQTIMVPVKGGVVEVRDDKILVLAT